MDGGDDRSCEGRTEFHATCQQRPVSVPLFEFMSMSTDAAIPLTASSCELFPESGSPAVWLFPGLGCRFVGMGADVLGKYPGAKELVAQANEYLGWNVVAACLEGGGRKFMPPRQESQLIYTVCCVYATVLLDRGYHPLAVCGHSLGTWAAVHVAGGYDFLAGLKLVSWVEDALESQVDGRGQSMGVVIGLPEETLTKICRAESNACLANINCPGQYLIGGSTLDVKRVLAAAHQAGAYKAKLMPIARAMHTPLLDDLNADVGRMLNAFPLRPPRVPLVSAWDGAKLTHTEEIRRYLSDFLARPVRWETALRRLLVEPHASFIEVGPAAILSGMMPFLDRSVRVPTASEVLYRFKPKSLAAEDAP